MTINFAKWFIGASLFSFCTSAAAFAQGSDCPHTVRAGQATNIVQEKNRDEYRRLENLVIVEKDDGLATQGLQLFLEGGAPNDYERQLVLKLLTAVHFNENRLASAARVFEEALRIGADRSLRTQVHYYRRLILLYRHLGDQDGEERIFQLWSACGGEQMALRKVLFECGGDFNGFCLQLGAEKN